MIGAVHMPMHTHTHTHKNTHTHTHSDTHTHTHSDTHTYQPNTKLFVVDKNASSMQKILLITKHN